MHCIVTLGKHHMLMIPKFTRDALGIGPGTSSPAPPDTPQMQREG